jgi:hypothetical protein
MKINTMLWVNCAIRMFCVCFLSGDTASPFTIARRHSRTLAQPRYQIRAEIQIIRHLTRFYEPVFRQQVIRVEGTRIWNNRESGLQVNGSLKTEGIDQQLLSCDS